MAFQTAMKMIGDLYTWNGASTLEVPDRSQENGGMVSLFFKTVRGIQDSQLTTYMDKACAENLTDTIVLAFHVRDCRGGKGERDIGRKMFQYLIENHPLQFKKVMHLVPEYGRYDDILCFFPGVHPSADTDKKDDVKDVRKSAVVFISQKLKEDIALMNEGKPISLCGKWVDTETSTANKKFKSVDRICLELCISKKEYRQYVSALRSYINIVEKLMCQNRWNEIDFSKVPSCAMMKLKVCFQVHTPQEFLTWKAGLKSGATTINAKQLQPHEIIKALRTKGMSDEILDAQWKVIEDDIMKIGSFDKTVVVVDTSGSMHTPNFLPLDISCALGLLISKMTKGVFKNNVITFDTSPTFVEVQGTTLQDRYYSLKNIPWGGSTNIQKTFEMILDKCTRAEVPAENMPERIIIISDMQFNQVEVHSNLSNFENIEKMYKDSGYKRPKIVFLNVNGESTDFPVDIADNGTVMISGSSPYILKALIKSNDFDTLAILKETINDVRYEQIRQALL